MDFEAGPRAAQEGDFVTDLKESTLLAECGHAFAQSKLGSMYENGTGVPQDYAEAVKWYRLAADQGDAIAQSNFGLMYTNGYGVPQDNVIALMWVSLASGNGHPGAGKWRNKIAAQMTPAEISEAQRRTRVCLASNYQDCD